MDKSGSFRIMKNLITVLCLLMSIGFGQLDKYEPYLSPGIQLGFNSDKGFFYGLQISMGVSYSPEEYIYSPSICFGFKKYNKSRLNEKYIDLQMMSLPDGRVINQGFEDSKLVVPIGFGVGINHFNGQSNMRIKGYTWFGSCFTIGYNIKEESFNLSLIPVLPISDSM